MLVRLARYVCVRAFVRLNVVAELSPAHSPKEERKEGWRKERVKWDVYINKSSNKSLYNLILIISVVITNLN